MQGPAWRHSGGGGTLSLCPSPATPAQAEPRQGHPSTAQGRSHHRCPQGGQGAVKTGEGLQCLMKPGVPLPGSCWGSGAELWSLPRGKGEAGLTGCFVEDKRGEDVQDQGQPGRAGTGSSADTSQAHLRRC